MQESGPRPPLGARYYESWLLSVLLRVLPTSEPWQSKVGTWSVGATTVTTVTSILHMATGPSSVKFARPNCWQLGFSAPFE